MKGVMLVILLLGTAVAAYAWRCDLLNVCGDIEISSLLSSKKEVNPPESDVSISDERLVVEPREITTSSVGSPNRAEQTQVSTDQQVSINQQEDVPPKELTIRSSSTDENLSNNMAQKNIIQSIDELDNTQDENSESDVKSNKTITVYFDTDSSELNITEEKAQEIQDVIDSHAIQ